MRPDPPWLDRRAFPYVPRYFAHEGHQLHYVDEGQGDVVLLVHGTPSWSWEWRAVIAALRETNRVLCLDWLGFGLSDQPQGADYRPEAHAARLAAFADAMHLDGITLVLHDYGGPVGLSFGVDHAPRIRRLAAMNTFCWADPGLERTGWVLGTFVGKLAYLQLNVSPRFIAPMAWGDKRKLTDAVQRHYLGPFPSPASRVPLWELARGLRDSASWFDEVWSKRERLADRPSALVWGQKDPAFGGKAFLDRWHELLPEAEVTLLPGAGHFPQEEDPIAVSAALTRLLAR